MTCGADVDELEFARRIRNRLAHPDKSRPVAAGTVRRALSICVKARDQLRAKGIAA
jgi:hypothetical protein